MDEKKRTKSVPTCESQTAEHNEPNCGGSFWLWIIVANLVGIIITAVFWIWAKVQEPSLAYYMREDNLFESLSAIFFFLACPALIIASLRHPAVKSHRTRGIFLWMWAFLFLIFAMKEISWGQRLFHVKTPEILKDGGQDELNLHNTFLGRPLGGTHRWLSLMILSTGIALPLARLWKPFGQLLDRFSIPLPQSHYIAWFLGGYLLTKILYHQVSFDAAEVREFIFSCAYLAFAIHAALKPVSTFRPVTR